MPLLRVSDLELSFDGQPILRKLSLEMPERAIHAVVGPNGAGKTTLASVLMGLEGYQPDGGSIEFAGHDLADLPINERAALGMSLAWQEPARFEGLTVGEFLAVGAVDKSETALANALRSVALDPEDYMARAVDTGLSGGERKRVELASIAVMEPRLVILDEPDSGIDVEALRAIFELLHDLKHRGSSVLLVTHSSEVLGHADTATLVCCGKDVDRGPSNRIQAYFREKCIPCAIHNPDIVEG